VASLHCGHPDATVDTAVTAVAQFIAIIVLGVFTLRCGSVVVDLCEMCGQVLINSLILAAGSSYFFILIIFIIVVIVVVIVIIVIVITIISSFSWTKHRNVNLSSPII